MRSWISLFLFLMVLTGCDDDSTAQDSGKPTTPSPIADFDKTRLWILTQASKVGDGSRCSDYYRKPEDPRYRGFAERCEIWSLDFTDYLRLNGLPTLEPEHVRELVYWDWFDATFAKIADCRTAVIKRKLPPRDIEAHNKRSYDGHACDPYQHEVRNNKKTPEELGIVFKARR